MAGITMSSNKAEQDGCSKAIRLSRLRYILASIALISSHAYAGPEGGTIAAGQGSITSSQTSTLIQQQTNSLIIDWQSFNIGANELVKFNQPSSSAAALNRIQDQMPSQIFGSLQANGLILLMNPNGVFFGETASVQVGGLVATNLEINADLFMRGNYNLESLGTGQGMIVNRGLIVASTGGVSLISDTGVVNEGKILATFGSINLATAKTATLDFDGDKLLQLSVDGEVLENALALDAAITNSGEIISEGGDVIISGAVARDVFTNVVNNTGIIKATRIINEGGVIRLSATSGDITNSGTLDVSGAEAGDITLSAANIINSNTIDASATEGDGGTITLQSSEDTFLQEQSLITVQAEKGTGGTVQVLGERVGIFDNAEINASGLTGGGEVLIGGDFQGRNASVQNASQTYVGADTSIVADGVARGDGGKVIVWADNTTQYYGDISVTGGSGSGNGGFIEVSGKNFLQFDGTADTSALNGSGGTLLLDPDNIDIVAGTGGSDDSPPLDDNIIAFIEGAGLDYTISEDVLESLSGNVVLQAEIDITLVSLDDSILNFVNLVAGDSVVFQAGNDIVSSGFEIRTNGGDIHLEADSPNSTGGSDGSGALTLGLLTSNGGNITLLSSDGLAINSAIAATNGDIFISTSDNSSIDLDSYITQAEYDLITTTGALTIGKATDAGSDGMGLGASDQYASSLALSEDITVASATTAALNFFSTNGFSVTGNTDDLFVNQDLMIDADADSNASGIVNIEGQIQATGSQSITITAFKIEGDNDNTPGDIPNDTEIITTGVVDLSAGEIAITDKPLNVSATSLIITDLGNDSGDVEINLNGGTGINVEVSTGVLSLTAINILNDFTYNTAGTIGIGPIGASGKNITVNATSGITSSSSNVFAADLTMTAEGVDAVIGANGNEINTVLSGSLTATASNGTGGIYISQTGVLDIASIDTGSGDLELTSSSDIIDSGTQIVGGAATFIAGDGGDILLDDASNNYGSTVSFAASSGTLNDVTFVDNSALDLQASTIGGDLDITATSIAQSGILDVTGTSSFSAALDNNITLNQANTFGNTVNLSTSGTGNVSVTDADAIELGTVAVDTGTFTVTAVTDIADLDAQAVNVNGAASFIVGDGGNITLDNGLNNYTSTVSFSPSAGTLNNVTFVNDATIDLQASTVGGNLSITSVSGAVMQSGILDVTGTSSFSAALDNDITLGQANTFGGAVSLSTSGTGNVFITDADAIQLDTVSVGSGTLTVNAGTDITSSGSGTQVVTVGGAATFNVGTAVTGNITLDGVSNSFGSTVTFASVTGLGNVTFVDTTAYDVQAGGLTVSGNLDITAAGIAQGVGDSLSVLTGTASFTSSGATDIDLTDVSNDFGSTVSINTGTGNAQITDANAIDLSTSNVGGNLTVTALAGAIAQTGGTLDVTGTSSFNAALDSDITLADPANTFGGAVNLSTSGIGNVSITDADAIELGTVSIDTGTFTVTAVTNITDLDAQAVNVNGTANFIVGNAGNIILDNGLNNYTSTVSFAPSAGTLSNVTFVNDATIDLQASTIGGNLSITSVSGAVMQSGILDVTGTSSFSAALDNNITLNQANTFGNTVNLSTSGTGNVSVTDADAIELGTVAVDTGTLTVTAVTDITDLDAQAVNVNGAASFIVGDGGNIILDNGLNNYTSTVSFSPSAGTLNNVTFVNDATIDLQASTVGGNLSITSVSGAVMQSGILDVTGTSSFSAALDNDITLGQANTFGGAVSLSTSGTGNVFITDADAIQLDTVSVGSGTLTVNAGTDITSSGSGTQVVTVGGAATFNVGTAVTGNITLDGVSNSFGSTVTFASVTGLGNVTFVDTTAYDVQAGGLTVSGNLDITAAGIAQGVGDSLSVLTGTASFTASGATDIALADVANDFGGAVSVNTGTGNANITDANAIDLGVSNVGGDLTVVATSGSITGSGTVTVGGNANFTANTGASTIGTNLSALSTVITGILTASTTGGAGGIYIDDSGSLEINTVNASTGDVELTSGGTITDATGADTTVDITANNLIIDATGGTGVDATDALNLDVNTLTIATSTGDFFLTQVGALTLGAVTVGSIDLFAGGNLTVVGNVTTTAGDLALGSGGILSIFRGSGITVGGTFEILDPGVLAANCPGSCPIPNRMFATQNKYDSVTLDSSAGGDIFLAADDIVITNGAANSYALTGSVAPNIFLGTDFFFNEFITPDATLNAGANSVVFDTNTASNVLVLGTMLTQGEINRITAASTIQFGTLANTGGVQLASSLNTSAITNTSLLTSGAVTSSLSTNTLTANGLSIVADNGIGASGSAFGIASSSVSAVNNVSGDIFLSITGANVTLGGAGTITNNVADSTISISSTGNLIIDTDFSVSGNGTISLDATGAITRTGGTVTANTVNLGTGAGGPAATTGIGASGTPVLVSTSNLNASTTTGDIYLVNDQAVNLILNSGGLANFTNTAGGISSVAAQAISAVGNLTLRADDMEFSSTSTVSGTNINLFGLAAGTGYLLGDNTDAANQIELADTELQALSSTGTVTLGESGVTTADIILGGAANLSGESFALTLTTAGQIDTPSTTNVLSLNNGRALTFDALDIGATNPVETVASLFDITTNNGDVNIDNGTNIDDLQLSAGSGIVDMNNTGYLVANTALSAGSFIIDAEEFIFLDTGGSMNASVGDISLTVTPIGGGFDFIILEDGTSITAGAGDLFLTADRMIFDFNVVLGTTSLTANNISINPFTATDPDGAGPLEAVNIVIGSPTADFSDTAEITLNLNSVELAMLNSNGEVIIGGVGYTGNIDMGQTIVDLSTENFDFTVTTAGAIDDSTGASQALLLNTGKLLTLNAGTGIGNTNAITFTTDSVSALNTTSGSLALAPTGTITLGGVGISIDQQAVGGAMSIIAGGDIIIAADVSVSGGGTSTVTLDANGTITRTDGTVIAETINLGSVSTTTLGTSGAPVFVDSSFLNINNTGDSFIEGVNAAGTNVVRGTMANLTYEQTGAGNVSLGNITTNTLDVMSNGTSDVEGVIGEGVIAVDVTIDSAGSIGGNTQLTVDATTSLGLTSNGIDAAGDINIRSNLGTTVSPTLSTDGGSTQTIAIELASIDILSTINTNDNLLFTANVGNIQLGADVTASNLYLVSSGAVTQTVGVITANELQVRSTNVVTLSGNNDVNTIAGNVSGAGSDFTYNDVNGLIVGSVTEPANVIQIDGITTNGGNINLTTGGVLSQSATGAITGNTLTVSSSGGALLNSATNAVNSINATDSGGGNIALTNGIALDVTNLSTSGDVLLDAASLTDSGPISANLLTTVTSGGSALNNNVTVTSYNGTDTVGGNIILVNNGGLDLTGISTTGTAAITTGGALTGSGVITAGLFAATTTGGITLNNASNNVGAFTAKNSDANNISLVDTGSLDLRSVVTGGNITISSDNIGQTQDVASAGGGNITVTANTGDLSMVNGTRTSTVDGTITYNANGDLNLSLLDAAFGVAANVGTVNVTSTAGSMFSTDFFNASVRANIVNLDASTGNIGANELNAFVLSSDIQGLVTLRYVNAFITTSPNINIKLNILDLGSGFINAGAARSAGTQRSQNTGLEDIGFIDLALFSDINLFVVDGIGIKLPISQSDVAPSVIEDLPVPDRIPVEDDDEEERVQLNISAAN